MTVATWVCCSMTSLTQMRYGSRLWRQGRSRWARSNQASKRGATQRRRAGGTRWRLLCAEDEWDDAGGRVKELSRTADSGERGRAERPTAVGWCIETGERSTERRSEERRVG